MHACGRTLTGMGLAGSLPASLNQLTRLQNLCAPMLRQFEILCQAHLLSVERALAQSAMHNFSSFVHTITSWCLCISCIHVYK